MVSEANVMFRRYYQRLCRFYDNAIERDFVNF